MRRTVKHMTNGLTLCAKPGSVRALLRSGSIALVALTFILPAARASAQTALSEAVLVTSERDPGITALRHKVARRGVEIQAARDERYPRIGLSADTATTSTDGPGVTLTVSQMLFDWGRVSSNIAAASQDRIAAVAELKSGVEELSLDVSGYFIDVEVINRKITHTQEYLRFATRICDHAEARARAGSGDLGEVARARLEVSRTEERLVQLQSDRKLALAQLEFLMGRAPGALRPAPDLAFLSRYSKSEAVASAIRLAPKFIAAQAGAGRAEAEIQLARAARLPSIRLQAQVRGDLDRGRTRTSIGLSTGLDVGMGAITGRQMEAARLAAEAAKSNQEAVRRNLANAVRSALESISVLRAREASQGRQLSQATDVLSGYEAQFIAGQRQLIDLLTTGRDLYDAQIDRIATYEERKRAEYEAAFDLGVLGTLILASTKGD